MRIGVVSDTHNNLRNVAKIVELFNSAQVDRVIHTGDITQAKTLDVFARLEMPLYGVFGNNDQERDTLDAAIARHGFQFIEPPLSLVWAERRIVVVHDPRDVAAALDGHHLVLHGHTHRRHIEREATHLVFNPGESAGHMEGHNAIGILDLATMEPEIVRF
jgi:putative phosphoesterase